MSNALSDSLIIILIYPREPVDKVRCIHYNTDLTLENLQVMSDAIIIILIYRLERCNIAAIINSLLFQCGDRL